MFNKIKYFLKDIIFSDLKRIIMNIKYINNTTIIGKAKLVNVNMEEYCSFADNSFIVNSNIGRFTSIGRNTTIINAEIGRFCSISWNITIGATQHYINRLSTHAFYYVTNYGFVKENKKIVEKVYVGNDVWVGANAIIMPGINISDGAIIGAGSVVTKDIPPYAIVAGNPAKILRYRFDNETIEYISDMKWYDWDIKKLKMHKDIFEKEFKIK